MKRLAVVIACLPAIAGVVSCGGKERAPEEQRQPIQVTVVPVTTLQTTDRLEAGGVVAAQETASLSSRMVAAIVDVRVTAGDRVRAGDMLVSLDARDVIERTHQMQANALAAEKSLAQARTEQTAAEAEQRLATAWHTRIITLHSRNSSTDQERDEADARLAAAATRVAGALAAIEVAEANLASARSAVGAATANESYTTIRAPFDGLITERLTDPGNLAAPGVPLLRIESDGARQVLVRVDEARAAYVHSGDTVALEIDHAGDPAVRNKALEGVVTEVARAIGTDQRAFTVKVTIPRSVSVRSGTFARVIFRGASRRALVVPTHAIRRQGQVSSVYVVQDGVARLRLIQTGLAFEAGTEVLAGLDAGESVIASPSSRVADGARVAIGAPTSSGGTP